PSEKLSGVTLRMPMIRGRSSASVRWRGRRSCIVMNVPQPARHAHLVPNPGHASRVGWGRDRRYTAARMAKGEPKIEQLRYEQAVERLEQLIERIESGEIGLEESLQQYETGMALIQRCRAILTQAERKIAELTIDDAGEVQAEADED